MQETLYTPKSSVRHPIRLIKEMKKDLFASRELALRLIIRDISAQYRQTVLGYFWAVFPPIVTTLVFILLNYSKNLNVSESIVSYPVYVMVGTVFWQLFVDALNAPLKIATESKSIITKINLPKEALILSGIGQALFSFVIKLILMIITILIFGVSVKWTVIFAFIPMIALLILGTMIGIFLIPFGLLFKDIQSALLIATSGLVFITPVGYTSKATGILGKIISINPLTPLINVTRDLFFIGMPDDIISFLWVFSISIILIFIGWIFYRISLPIVVERIGA